MGAGRVCSQTMTHVGKVRERPRELELETRETAVLRERALRDEAHLPPIERLRSDPVPESRLGRPTMSRSASLRGLPPMEPRRLATLAEAELHTYQRRVQSPKNLERVVAGTGLQVAVVDRPALGARTTTGDHYTAHAMADGRVVFVVGDGKGHGVAAARDSATLAAHLADPATIARVFPQATTADVALATLSSEMIPHYDPDTRGMAAAVMIFDHVKGDVDFANAAMPVELLVRKADGRVTRFAQRGGYLGDSVFGYDHAVEGHRVVKLEPGDTVILPSDGMADATARDPERRDNLDRLAALVAAPEGNTPEGLAKILRKAAGKTGVDDAVAVIVRWPGPPVHFRGR